MLLLATPGALDHRDSGSKPRGSLYACAPGAVRRRPPDRRTTLVLERLTVGTHAQPVRDAWQEQITDRLAAGDISALMELYDRTAQQVYSYALRASGSTPSAYEFTREAFLNVWLYPDLLRDARVPAHLRLAALTHFAAHEMDNGAAANPDN